MHDDDAMLDWYACNDCGMDYTWFRVEILEGLEMYGWLHRRMYSGCKRDKGMEINDMRQ